MASLYDLTGVYKNLLDSVIDWETGEVDEENVPNFGALFEGVEDGIKSKLDGCARVLRTLKSEAEELKREEERIAKRRKSLERNHEALKDYMLGCMQFADIRNIKTALFTMFLSAPKPSVKVTDLKKLPAKYKIEQDPKPDKKALMVELKAGKKVEGAELNEGKESLVVR